MWQIILKAQRGWIAPPKKLLSRIGHLD